MNKVKENHTRMIKREDLGDLKKSTENFFIRSYGYLVFSSDDNISLDLGIFYTGNKANNYSSVEELMNGDKDNIILFSRHLSRIENIYNPEAPSASETKRYYQDNYIDYSYLLKIAKLYDIDFKLSNVEDGFSTFNFSWKDKNKFTKIEVQTDVDWAPKKRMCK